MHKESLERAQVLDNEIRHLELMITGIEREQDKSENEARVVFRFQYSSLGHIWQDLEGYPDWVVPADLVQLCKRRMIEDLMAKKKEFDKL